jgi:hypothetical protein
MKARQKRLIILTGSSGILEWRWWRFASADGRRTWGLLGTSSLKEGAMLYIRGFLRYATIIGGLASFSSNNVTSSIVTLTTIRHMLLWYFGILLKSSVVWELFRDRREWGQRTSRGWTLFGALMIGERSTWVNTVDDEGIRSSGLVQFNDVYAEVPLWSASVPIARRWIVPTCVWKLHDCRVGVSVGRLPQDVLLE